MAAFLLPTICWIPCKWPIIQPLKYSRLTLQEKFLSLLQPYGWSPFVAHYLCCIECQIVLISLLFFFPVELLLSHVVLLPLHLAGLFAWVALISQKAVRQISCLPLPPPVPTGLSRGLYKMNASCEWLSVIINESPFLCSRRFSLIGQMTSFEGFAVTRGLASGTNN